MSTVKLFICQSCAVSTKVDRRAMILLPGEAGNEFELEVLDRLLSRPDGAWLKMARRGVIRTDDHRPVKLAAKASDPRDFVVTDKNKQDRGANRSIIDDNPRIDKTLVARIVALQNGKIKPGDTSGKIKAHVDRANGRGKRRQRRDSQPTTAASANVPTKPPPPPPPPDKQQPGRKTKK